MKNRIQELQACLCISIVWMEVSSFQCRNQIQSLTSASRWAESKIDRRLTTHWEAEKPSIRFQACYVLELVLAVTVRIESSLIVSGVVGCLVSLVVVIGYQIVSQESDSKLVSKFRFSRFGLFIRAFYSSYPSKFEMESCAIREDMSVGNDWLELSQSRVSWTAWSTGIRHTIDKIHYWLARSQEKISSRNEPSQPRWRKWLRNSPIHWWNVRTVSLRVQGLMPSRLMELMLRPWLLYERYADDMILGIAST